MTSVTSLTFETSGSVEETWATAGHDNASAWNTLNIDVAMKLKPSDVPSSDASLLPWIFANPRIVVVTQSFLDKVTVSGFQRMVVVAPPDRTYLRQKVVSFFQSLLNGMVGEDIR